MDNPFEIIIQQNAEILKRLQRIEESNAGGSSLQTNKEDLSENDQDFNITQIAKYLNKDVSTIHRYKKNGALPFLQVGRTVLFRKSAVDAAMSSMTKLKKGATK